MSNLILPLSAGAVGYTIGGPTGAALGFTLVAGLTADDVDLKQPAVGDLLIQTSSYGEPIPEIVGRVRIAGNIIWADEKKTVISEQRVGKGGGGSTQSITTYTLSYAIMLCKGPILGITRVWRDGTLVVDGTNSGSPSARNLPGTLYLGTNTQTADPTIEAVEGSGNVPGYRGTAYIVLEDDDLGVSGRVPMWSFEVIKEGGF